MEKHTLLYMYYILNSSMYHTSLLFAQLTNWHAEFTPQKASSNFTLVNKNVRFGFAVWNLSTFFLSTKKDKRMSGRELIE